MVSPDRNTAVERRRRPQMLMSNEFVRAEDKYRRDLLRDQYQTQTTGRVGKVVAVLVVAGALLLAACGDPGDTNPGARETTATEATTEQGSADDVTVVPAPEKKTPEEEFSGVSAPDWHPMYGRLPLAEHETRSGPR
jgi:hypothetical protein